MKVPGQRYREDFPRFGLPAYADRFPSNLISKSISIEINGVDKFEIEDALASLPRVTQTADFHCVTTWSFPNVDWGGVMFKDFYKKHIACKTDSPISGAIIYAQDGYKTTLLLEDLLGDNTMLVDSMDGQLLSIEHGAPLRLLVPDHYGYKNLKHLTKIEFFTDMPVVKRGLRAFLDHPRARVNLEERGRWIPGWILRYLYRPLISGGVKEFRQALLQYNQRKE